MKNNTILKVRDVCKLLGVGQSTVYRAVETGRLPAVRIGTAIRFRPEALEQFLRQQESRALDSALRK
ncbi:MAG: helix-turn-helix domain-containing protein [Armatimonadetes bacterium]|nr:helix-turn-helix domain-containing protein [Armatimonadota bacterium]